MESASHQEIFENVFLQYSFTASSTIWPATNRWNSEAQLKKAALTFWIPGPGVQKMKPTAIQNFAGVKNKKTLRIEHSKRISNISGISKKNAHFHVRNRRRKLQRCVDGKFFLRLRLRVFSSFSYPPVAEIPAEKTMYLFKVSKLPILNRKS